MERTNFIKLISLYAGLFIFAYLIINRFELEIKNNFWYLAGIGILFRLLFITAIPNLSQDFYRFIWDGHLVAKGISPYLFTPNLSGIIGESIPQSQKLLDGMGSLSATNFSNYPPINQLFFAIAALFSGKTILGSVLAMRLILSIADIGILYFGKKILQRLNLPIKNIFWYFLNPFIIIELTGNLHFEGVMLLFFVCALYLLLKAKWFWAAILIGLSISVKLIPILFLPLFLMYFTSKNRNEENLLNLNLKALIQFYLVIGLTVVLSLLPFLSSGFISNFSSTIALWFQNFEFNASVYYILRWIGYETVGWNLIGIIGKILPLIVLLFVLVLSFLGFKKYKTAQLNMDKRLFTLILFSISFYFLLSTTVHPWYIATPLLLCVFTQYRFPVVWSFMIILSYSAYGKEGFAENLWLVGLEYLMVIGYAIYEISKHRKSHQIL